MSKRLHLGNAFVVVLILASQTSCGGSYRVDSNISPEKWDDYYKHNKVAIYQREVLAEASWKSLGIAQGVSCQEQWRDPPPSIGQARTEIRRDAADLGANGLVDLKCLDDAEAIPGCQASISCFAEAVWINDPPED